MPVTAKLSRKLYDVLTEDVVNELVEWFNLIDATYRSDLRELNEANFGRLDAKQEQRFAQFETKLEQRLAQFDAKLERSLAELRGEMSALRTEMREGFAAFRTELANQRADLLKWMFLFWATTALGVIGLLKF